ncbi:unnamed protein product [Linum tenue]|uniref:Uncharacterized protein n=1 Tax=Linum tenue TaxID=586396 RepID=A0AAV0IV90_9ROSI|nr:unnamed protein product [Linum tenue]
MMRRSLDSLTVWLMEKSATIRPGDPCESALKHNKDKGVEVINISTDISCSLSRTTAPKMSDKAASARKKVITMCVDFLTLEEFCKEKRVRWFLPPAFSMSVHGYSEEKIRRVYCSEDFNDYEKFESQDERLDLALYLLNNKENEIKDVLHRKVVMESGERIDEVEGTAERSETPKKDGNFTTYKL